MSMEGPNPQNMISQEAKHLEVLAEQNAKPCLWPNCLHFRQGSERRPPGLSASHWASGSRATVKIPEGSCYRVLDWLAVSQGQSLPWSGMLYLAQDWTLA